jgi:UDP-N-acetylmuramate dehydrogenase
MVDTPTLVNELFTIPDSQVLEEVPLNRYTRFGIGGPARVFLETASESSFMQALEIVENSGSPYAVIGGGTNLIVCDTGFDGVVLRFTAKHIGADGTRVTVAAGAVLQDLIDFTVIQGLAGIHTMTGIPGYVGAAVYGNAGAYGRSIAQSVNSVRFFDGAQIRVFDNKQCEFRYRESVFKRQKRWIIFSTTLELEPGDAAELYRTASGILDTRNRKYPPTMKCAGSIFKNLLLKELPRSIQSSLPDKVVIEGKVPSAYFLEQVGAKGMKNGDIHVADYHANLIYNAGDGTAAQLVAVIADLKTRVRDQFGFDLEEEVQYVGF